jgi:hypothetical protein
LNVAVCAKPLSTDRKAMNANNCIFIILTYFFTIYFKNKCLNFEKRVFCVALTCFAYFCKLM